LLGSAFEMAAHAFALSASHTPANNTLHTGPRRRSSASSSTRTRSVSWASSSRATASPSASPVRLHAPPSRLSTFPSYIPYGQPPPPHLMLGMWVWGCAALTELSGSPEAHIAALKYVALAPCVPPYWHYFAPFNRHLLLTAACLHSAARLDTGRRAQGATRGGRGHVAAERTRPSTHAAQQRATVRHTRAAASGASPYSDVKVANRTDTESGGR
jgi:hypothetical protein